MAVAAIIVLAILGISSYSFVNDGKISVNPLQSLKNAALQSKIDHIIETDTRNSGIEVSVYYGNAFDTSVLVFDLQNVSANNSRLDVFRIVLDFAEKMKEESCSTVELAFRGDTKFLLPGDYFQKLGEERHFQNPVYTIRTFPENLRTPSNQRAYSQWTGGMLGVLNAQMDDANDFHAKWYLDELKASY